MSILPYAFRHAFAQGTGGWFVGDPEARVVTWLDRDALILGGGRPVLAPATPEPPYTIRTTLSGGPAESYIGCCFHLHDTENFETIYLAPHAGGQPEAIQYDPVINGSHTWQIFGDADGIAAAPLEQERWHLLRVDVWPDIARVYVDDERSPKATFPLRSGGRGGPVGLWGYLPSHVADFELRPIAAPPPPFPTPKVSAPPGTMTEWLVAKRDTQTGAPGEPRLAKAEHNGVVCLNRLYRAESGARALAACEIEVPAGVGDIVLEAGYSDRARIWLDDQLVHEGEWIWDPNAGADGRVRPGHDKIVISAAPGWHLLLAEIAVLEPGFGWGLTARAVAAGRPCHWRPAAALEAPRGLGSG